MTDQSAEFREALARIINPLGWKLHDDSLADEVEAEYLGYHVDDSLDTADEILLFLSATPAPATVAPVVQGAPARIWLHGIGDDHGETVWCDDPNPSGEPEEAEHAVEYVRADLALPEANAGGAK